MNPDIIMLFDRAPGSYPIYERLESRILETYPEVTLKVGSSMVSFYNSHHFAGASPPYRRKRDWPKIYVMVSFGLEYELEHPRIVAASEPYPNRWTHHVLLQSAEEIDDQLMEWIGESYRFSLSKGRKNK